MLIQLFYCLLCFLGRLVLHKSKAHRFALFIFDYFCVFNWTYFIEKLIQRLLLSLKIEIFNVDDLTELFCFFSLFLQVFNFDFDILLTDHTHWSVLEVEKGVFEFLILQVLHHILCELGVLQLDYSDGSIGS